MLNIKIADKNMFALLAVNCFRTISSIFLGTFLVSFIFNQTGQDAAQIGSYNLFCYLMVGVLAYLTGNWVKRGNRLLMYRLGVWSNFFFMIAIMVFQESIVNYIPLCGIICGLIIAFKAFPFNLIVADSIEHSKMISFRGYMGGLEGITKASAPFLLGIFLTFESYFKTAGFLAVLSLVELLLVMQISSPVVPEQPKFNLKEFWLKIKGSSAFKNMYKMELLRGMTIDGTLETLVTLYIIYLFKTDFNLGAIISFFYLVTIALNVFFGRFCKYSHFERILFVTITMVIFSSLVFVYQTGEATFVLYNFCFVTAIQLLRIIADVNIFNMSNLPDVKEYKNEYFALREIIINGGRVVSSSLLIGVGLTQNFEVMKYLLILLTVLMTLMGIYSVVLNRQLNR